MSEQLKKRLKGFFWGMGSAVAITALSYTIKAVPDLGLGEFATMAIILACEQTTKYLNK